MVDIAKIDMTNIWASSGDKTMPDVAKIAQGWIVETVPRQTWNWFENRQDQNIAYMLQKGIPEWDAGTEYQANKSYVQRLGVIYKAILTGSNQDPNSATTYWVKAFVESTSYIEAIKSLTPTASTTSYINASGVAANAAISTFVVGLLASANAGAFRNSISAQALNSNLTALSNTTAATNSLPFYDSTTSMSTTPITAVGRSVVGAVDAAGLRTLLALGNVATLNTGTTTGTVATGDDARIVGAMQKASNLSDVASVSTARTNLGLGTAAVGTVTTSTTDTTAGRLTKVGDFGIGGTGIRVGDINALIPASPNGIYNLGTPFTGAPVSGQYFTVIHTSLDNQATQYATLEGAANPRLFMRQYNNSAWQAWTEFYSSNNTAGIVTQVQTGIQPTLDAKLNRTGDTVTGPFYNTSTGVGFQSVSTAPKFEMQKPNVLAGMWWINASNQFALATTAGDGNASATLMSIDSVGNTVVAGKLTANNGLAVTGATALAGTTVSGALNVTGSDSAGASIYSAGNTFVKGGMLAIFAASSGANAHTYYYNNDGTVRAIVYSDSANAFHVQVAGTERLIITAAGSSVFYGQLTAQGGAVASSLALYAGSSFHDTNGNLYGPAWSGYLSTYLTNNFITASNLGQNYVNAVGAPGVIGSYAYLGNTSGTNIAPGGYLSSGLSYGSSNSNAGGTAAGTWRAMGYGTNGGFTVWLRVA